MGDRCYCVFEGGGAKGIAHVGALAALEESNLELAGFAGTSAGAIVASLAAAGYTSEELFGPDESILDRIDLDASNVWGHKAWKPVRTPTRLLGRMAWMGIRTSQLAFKVGIPLILLLLILSSGVVHWLNWIGEGAEFAVQMTLVLLLVGVPFYIASPLAGLRRVADSIDQAIALKITGKRRAAGTPLGADGIPVGPKGVTFADLARAGRPPLKIVATDISKQRLALFSADSTPDVRIGDAVAASICLPGIFRPWKVESSLHYDGGLVSNLPAWTFDAERAIDRDAWTAVVEVSDKQKSVKPSRGIGVLFAAVRTIFLGRDPPRGIGILSATLNTALFGRASLNTRGVDRLRSAPLEVKLDLLQFGISREQAKSVVDEAKTKSSESLIYQLVVLPQQINRTCRRIATDSRFLINLARREEGGKPLGGLLRVGLLFPLKGETRTLLNEFSYGYADHTDERLRLPMESSIAGWALDGNKALQLVPKEPLYAERSDPQLWGKALSRPEDRWTRMLLWKDSAWVFYVPYYHAPSNVWLVAMVDCDRPLALVNRGTTLTELGGQIKAILRVSLPEKAFAWV